MDLEAKVNKKKQDEKEVIKGDIGTKSIKFKVKISTEKLGRNYDSFSKKIKDFELSKKQILDRMSEVKLKIEKSLKNEEVLKKELEKVKRENTTLRTMILAKEIMKFNPKLEIKKDIKEALMKNSINEFMNSKNDAIKNVFENQAFNKLFYNYLELKDKFSLSKVNLNLNKSFNSIVLGITDDHDEYFFRYQIRINPITPINPEIDPLKQCEEIIIKEASKFPNLISFTFHNDNLRNLSFLEDICFKNLTKLELVINQIKDLSPIIELKKLKSLTLILLNPRININSLFENISWIEELKLIIEITRNRFYRNLKLKELKSLKKLSINNYTEGISYSFLEDIKELKEISVRDKLVHDFGPFGNLKKLEKLSLLDACPTSILFIQNFTNLVELNLLPNENNYSRQPYYFGGYGGRDGFRLENLIHDYSPLYNLSQLRKLFLSNVPQISFLTNLPQLTHLTLYDSFIEDFSPLEKLPNLISLGLCLCSIVKLDFLKKLNLKKLQELNLSKNSIEDFSILLSSEFSELKTIYIFGNPSNSKKNKDAFSELNRKIIKTRKNYGNELDEYIFERDDKIFC